MTRDLILFVGLALSFAAAIVTHVGLSIALGKRSKPEGALALFVPPTAPVLAVRQKLYVGAALWLAFVVAYAALFLVNGR